MPGVLDGVRVLDLSWGIAGPMATMLLADNGADVTRVERPQGDPFATSSGYTVWNRGKRHTTIDLRDPSGYEQFLEGVAGADVVVESFGAGVAERLRVDHASLRAVNPGIITCSISGYGDHAAHRDRPAYDALVSARTGLFYDQRGRSGTAMEYIAGRPGPNPDFARPEGMIRGADRPGPVFPRSTFPSLAASMLATLGISAALRHRERTGQGQAVSTSLLQGALLSVAMTWQRVERPDSPLFWMWPTDSRAIEGLYQCRDERWVHHWTVRPNWVRSAAEGDSLEAFDTGHDYRADPDRLGMGPEDMLVGHFLHPDLVAAFKKFDSADWVRVGEASEMGISVVRSVAEALHDDAFLADGCVVRVEHPEHGPIRHIGNVLEFSDTDTASEVETVPGTVSTSTDTSGGPLSGVTVLDLGLGVAGPFAPRMLADLGASVIKINALHDGYWTGTHMGLGTNRGKRSIALNLKDPRGLEILHRLIDRADVLTTNWRPGAMARLGIDEDSLRSSRPDLIICNSRGYEKGPRSDLPGTDQTAAALCGVEWEDGACSAGNPPLWSRSGLGDTGNAMLSAIAITMALYHRERTGRGQMVSTSIVNAQLLNTSYAWVKDGSHDVTWDQVDAGQWGLHALYRMYQTADGYIAIAVVDDDAWTRLCAAVGDQLDLGNDTRFTSPDARANNDAALAAGLGEMFAVLTAQQAFDLLDTAGVPVEIVNEAFCRELFDDDEARSLGLIATSDSAAVGRFEDPGLLVNLSHTPGAVQRGPCTAGQHTREILAELGVPADEIALLTSERVVMDAADPPQ